MPFVVVLSFLRHSGRLPRRSFFYLLRRRYCCRPRSLIPFSHSGSSKVSSRTSFLSGFFVRHRPCFVPYACVLHCGSSSCRLRSFRGPQFPWVRILLKKFPSRRATAARRDTFLQTAANFLRDPQSPRVSSFGSPRRRAARCRPLCHFFSVPEDFTAASSVGTSRYSFGFGSLLSRHAAVVTWRTSSLFYHPSCLLSRH
jgi:hypothetical protein